jgi:phosphatidylserine/phosphatidylglycerophosphate/cardiolipin synthase-like enzyme
MVIRALDIVAQCYSNADGQKIYEAVYDYVARGEEVTVSFDGVDAVPSSFVNTAFIALLEHFPFQRIRETLSFSKTTPQINEMIRTRFAFESSRKAV